MRKIPGHAMLYTLMILLLVGSLLGMYIWHYALQGNWLRQHHQHTQLYRQLEGGIYTYLSQEKGEIGQFTYDIEGSPCHIHARPWGLFHLITGQVDTLKRTCLVGEKVFPIRTHSLWVKDQHSPISLVGQASLKGRLFLPQAGLRTAFLADRGFEGDQLFEGTKGLSGQVAKGFTMDYLDRVAPILEHIQALPTNGEKLLLTDMVLDQSWEGKSYELIAQGSLVLGDVHLRGAVQVMVRDTLWVSSSADLDHTLLIARHIVFGEGFEGRVQALALASIDVGTDCRLRYPSGLLLAPFSRQGSQLYIKDQSLVEGYVLATRTAFRSSLPQRADLVQVAQAAAVWGTVDTDLPLDLRGQVMGSVNATELVVALPSQRYKHALLDGRLDASSLSQQFAGPMIYGGGLFRVIEWQGRNPSYQEDTSISLNP